MRLITPLLTTTLLLTLGACAYISPPTVLSLSRLSPLEVDPSEIAVQIELPEGLAINQGSAKLTFALFDGGENALMHDEFTLVSTANQGKEEFRIAQKDLDDVRRLQANALRLEDNTSEDVSGSIGVHLGVCKTKDIGEKESVSVFIQTQHNAPFKPLLKNAPISAILRDANFDQQAIDRCLP